MSAALNEETDWNYRKIDQRLIVIKTKNQNVRKAAAIDVLTNLSFAINVPENLPMEDLQPEKQYLAHLKVYSSKNIEGVGEDFIDFFDAVDIDQAIEDFIKAYWIYPSKIRFDLESIEEP